VFDHAFFLVAEVPLFWDIVMATMMPIPTSATGIMLAADKDAEVVSI
jgi:hypothetical protein